MHAIFTTNSLLPCSHYCSHCHGLLVILDCIGQPVVFIKVRKFINITYMRLLNNKTTVFIKYK